MGWDESLKRLMLGGLGGLVVDLAKAGHTTRDLDLSALDNKGSLRIPFNKIESFESKRPFVLAYLTMRYLEDQGDSQSIAVVRESLSGKKYLDELAAVLKVWI